MMIGHKGTWLASARKTMGPHDQIIYALWRIDVTNFGAATEEAFTQKSMPDYD